MPSVIRVSDVIEVHAERAIYYAFGGLLACTVGGLFIYYHGQSNMFVPLGSIFLLIGVPLICFATYVAFQTREVEGKPIGCPFCEAVNEVVGDPGQDFACISCHRMIPIKEGAVLPVSQVRCGFCNELNYYSEKTEALLCEKCNHEIPISLADGSLSKKVIPSIYAVVDDEAYYELMLVGQGHKEEELIHALQQMLALNRNQVKQMLTELPVTLLTGITRKKAELLKAQLSLYDGEVEFKQMEEARY